MPGAAMVISVIDRKMLPQFDGPKLHPFSDQGSDIQFVRLLSDNESDTEGNGHSHVFEVIIRSRHYALKVFKFYDVECATSGMWDRQIREVTIKNIRFQADPFFNECRAYGKLIACGVNGKVALHCHGHLALPASTQDELYQRFKVASWNRPTIESRLPMSERQPLRAIVNESILRKMWKDLCKMRKLGVHPRDVVLRNYKGGLLLDFSIAVTKPHWKFKLQQPWEIRMMENLEMQRFQALIRDSGVNTALRAVRNREYCAKLRGCPGGRANRKRVKYPA